MTSNKPNQDESASRKRSLDAVNEPETGAELRKRPTEILRADS